MKLGIIGFGNMAEAILGGIISNDFVSADEVIISRRNIEKLECAKEKYGVQISTNNADVVRTADVLLLCVKPQMLDSVISEIKEEVKKQQLIISIAAGKSIEYLTSAFGENIKVVRAMPNTPAFVGEGCTGICFGDDIGAGEKKYVLDLFACIGKADEVPEYLMDAVGGVSGCSPAFVFMFIEALADGAVASGMPRKQAYEFAAQAVMGSAKLMLETGKHPGELKDMVCSPGGTTIQGVRTLEEKGFRAAVMDAVIATVEKSKKL